MGGCGGALARAPVMKSSPGCRGGFRVPRVARTLHRTWTEPEIILNNPPIFHTSFTLLLLARALPKHLWELQGCLAGAPPAALQLIMGLGLGSKG